jgi:hypothetical protein
MPTVNHRAVLAATYRATLKKIDAREIPTLPVQAGSTIFTNIDPNKAWTWLPKPKRVNYVSKFDANKLLMPRDGRKERENRFSGPSLNGDIPASGGLYCVLQQQAMVNERIYYSGRPGTVSLCGRCILRIRLAGSLLVAEISPHNRSALTFLRELGPGIEKELPEVLSRGDPKALDEALTFLRKLGADTWERMNNPNDCSVARGIGLAIASSGLRGLSAQTVRMSDRAEDERGDNLALFGPQDQPIRGLYIEAVSYFNNASPPKEEVFPVIFPGIPPK